MTDDQIQRLQDRLDVTDTIYRYASCIDRRDLEGLRAVLHDDIRARYGNADWIEGGDAPSKWIDEMTRDTVWQHHLLSVYHVDLDRGTATGPRRSCTTRPTRSSAGIPTPSACSVARYHDQLVRTPEGWRISRAGVRDCAGESEGPMPPVTWRLSAAAAPSWRGKRTMTSTMPDLSTYPISARHARPASSGRCSATSSTARSCRRSTAPRWTSLDPATGRRSRPAAAGAAADVDRAVRSARAAFDDGRWRDVPPLEKERRLRRLSALLAERGDEFAEIDVIDAGLLRMYTGFIVQFAVDGIDYYAGWPSKLAGHASRRCRREFAVYQLREPIGVIGLITPVERADGGASRSSPPPSPRATRVVLKPAEQTPMAAVLMAELALEAGHPARRVQRRAGSRRDVGRRAGRAPGRRRAVVHRLGRHRQRHPGRGRHAGQARQPRARAARARSSCSPTPTSRPPPPRR